MELNANKDEKTKNSSDSSDSDEEEETTESSDNEIIIKKEEEIKEIKKEKSRSRSRSSKHKKHHHHRKRRSSSRKERKHHRKHSSNRHRRHRSRSNEQHRKSYSSSSSSSKHHHNRRHNSPKRRTNDSKAESNENFKRKMEEMLNTNGRSNELEMQRRVELAKDKSGGGGVESVVSKEKLDGVKIPTFYNPNVVNPLVYAEQERKRKLLWSKSQSDTTSTIIVGKAIVESQDEKNALKFRKLMGIKETKELTVTTATTNDLNKMQNKTFDALDKEYQFARMATHTHRGMGLGFLSSSSADTSTSKQP